MSSTRKKPLADSVDATPTYLAIRRYFLDRIVSGELPVGARLPTEKEIARQFGTSRATVQNAMSPLVEEGRIEKRVGSGTFVAKPGGSATIGLVGARSFEDDAHIRGEKVDYRLLMLSRNAAIGDVADALDVKPGAMLLQFERLRLVRGRIIGLERRTMSPEFPSGISLDEFDCFSTHELVERHMPGSAGRMEASISAVSADEELATRLEIEVGAPLLLRRHRMISPKGRPVLLGEAFYCEPFAFRYTTHTPDQG